MIKTKVSPRGAFLEFTNHFLTRACYDVFGIPEIIMYAVEAMTLGERDLVAQFLVEAAEGDDERLRIVWHSANGQWGPAPESVRPFTDMCLEALRDGTIPFRSENRIVYSEEAAENPK